MGWARTAFAALGLAMLVLLSVVPASASNIEACTKAVHDASKVPQDKQLAAATAVSGLIALLTDGASLTKANPLVVSDAIRKAEGLSTISASAWEYSRPRLLS